MERLLIHNATLSDAGWYTCVVSNMYGQIQHSAWIEVLIEKTETPNEGSSHVLLTVTGLIAIVLFVTAVAVLAAICWQRRRPPNTRPLVLKENSIYFQPLSLPVDPDWEINRNQ